ncbi:uncharacterized protein Pyn_02402 [Prunus yedoensis var. nudiflora]|uniref:Transmembrane protein n=1 Tax=Prunus yedoensis var. nudiflora TaxID=2094558 RepID=A0A314Z0W3_PRUYE|nr:uncharacterized protein Pyn_02402 [Prunus yedoensis var. nudiflora]
MGSFMLLELVGTLWKAQKLFFRNVKLMFSIFLLIISLSSILFVSNMFSIKQLITDFAHETSLIPAMDVGTPEFANLLNTLKDQLRLFARLEWIFIFTFCFAWLFFATASISASAVTYCGKDLSIKELLSRAVKSLKRLFLTWFYITLLHLGYCLFFIAFLVPSLLIFDLTFTTVAFSITIFLLALVFQAYLAVVWNLALVVSVLEEICGIKALGKAEQLIKGSKRLGFSLNILFGALSLSVFCGVLMSENAAMIPLLLLNSMYCLIEMFKLMTYTILYHECKETHGEELEMQEGTKYTKVAFTPLISADTP